jgi:acetyl esterase/lipase
VESINLKDISHDVPMVVWFHGGGLTTGSSNFGWELKVNALLEKQKQVSGSECIPPLVVASVDYRLAPEHPLPAASIDALSVMDYCMKDDPERQIHVSGESAGGYLSLVSAFAGHKHYPGRVQSALVMIPFISPAADSMSYYMNGPSSLFAPASWARWCWRAALEMDDTVESEDDLLAVGSNRTAWDKSKWKQNEEWHKFLEPMEGVPSEMENGSKYIVAVNKADVVYDEGNELARRLKEHGADVEYLEASGSHGIGFYINRKAMAELIELWRAAIFDK